MTDKFLSPDAISSQIEKEGYEYYFIDYDNEIAGFTAFRREEESLFLSKLCFSRTLRLHKNTYFNPQKWCFSPQKTAILKSFLGVPPNN